MLVSVFVFNDTSPYSHGGRWGVVVLKHRSPPRKKKTNMFLFNGVLVVLTPYNFLFIVNIYTAQDFSVLYEAMQSSVLRGISREDQSSHLTVRMRVFPLRK